MLFVHCTDPPRARPVIERLDPYPYRSAMHPCTVSLSACSSLWDAEREASFVTHSAVLLIARRCCRSFALCALSLNSLVDRFVRFVRCESESPGRAPARLCLSHSLGNLLLAGISLACELAGLLSHPHTCTVDYIVALGCSFVRRRDEGS